MELAALQDVVADIESLGATLVAISPQLEKYTRQVVKKHGLTFSVLCDPGNETAARFGLAHRLPNDLRNLYDRFGIDLPRFNGDESGTLPMAGLFIIDGGGTIVHRDVHPDYTKRPEPSEIVTILKTIR